MYILNVIEKFLLIYGIIFLLTHRLYNSFRLAIFSDQILNDQNVNPTYHQILKKLKSINGEK